MGSDAIYTMFGQNTWELGWFVQAGMTPEQALQTATTTAADLLGKEKELCAVAPGYFADLVAVEGDPLADINVANHRQFGDRWNKNGTTWAERLARSAVTSGTSLLYRQRRQDRIPAGLQRKAASVHSKESGNGAQGVQGRREICDGFGRDLYDVR